MAKISIDVDDAALAAAMAMYDTSSEEEAVNTILLETTADWRRRSRHSIGLSSWPIPAPWTWTG